ncbi:hypothetical protein RND81_12G103700 [Saponaria officinalis]|uniref:Uncharacterized protein n=1 Tax=Saponaria officinalis TaxID=3572 RepID=A0AAW1H8W9_SAPOF
MWWIQVGFGREFCSLTTEPNDILMALHAVGFDTTFPSNVRNIERLQPAPVFGGGYFRSNRFNEGLTQFYPLFINLDNLCFLQAVNLYMPDPFLWMTLRSFAT